jgi:putative intracellular protease/amidase
MRQLIPGGLLAALLVGCGATPCPAPEPTQSHAQATVRGLPNVGTFRVAILAGPGVDDVELYGLWYPLAAQGWRVTLAVPALGPIRGAAGLPVPATRSYAALKPADFDVIYVPGGAPMAAAAVTRAFIDAGRPLITTTAGAQALAAAGLAVTVATDEQMVQLSDGVISAARPGDLPRLAHALQAYAEDTLRVSHKATGGHPP